MNPTTVAVVLAPHKDGWISSTRPIDKREHPGAYGVVGGKLDPGETPLQAAIREAREEGWSVHDVAATPVHANYHGPHKIEYFVAEGAKKLRDYKEKYREVYPMTVTSEELARSHPVNTFAYLLDRANLQKRILAQEVIDLYHKHGLDPTEYYHGDVLDKSAEDLQTSQTGGDGGVDGGFGITPPPPPQDEKAQAVQSYSQGQQLQQQIAARHLNRYGKTALPPRHVPGQWAKTAGLSASNARFMKKYKELIDTAMSQAISSAIPSPKHTRESR